jgi:hypothetical protein
VARTAKIKPEQEEAQEVSPKLQQAIMFAKKLASQQLHDPDGKTSRRKNRSYSAPTRETIEEYLRSPSTSEKQLRESSVYLYQINPRYRNLINYYASVPCWLYTISPVNYNPAKVKKEAFTKQYYRVCNILESMGVARTMRSIVVTALREGAFFGCVWGGNGDSFILQKLNPDYCAIVSITDGGVFQFKYDMSQVNEGDLPTYYPPAFTDMYKEYKRTGEKYQLVPPEIAICFKADPSIIDYSIPVFAGTMPTLFQIENSKEQSETSGEMSNYKLLAGKVPIDDEGIPLLDYNVAMDYYQHISQNVGDRVGVAISPFDLKEFSFEQNATAAQIDAVARASENYFAEAGTNASLHGSNRSNTTGVTKLAVNADEAFAFGLMYQGESIINRFLKLISGTVKFKIHFLDVSCFNRSEKIDQYRSAMNYGIGKLEFLALMDIRQHDIQGENYVADEILDIDNMFTPMKTASTQSGDTGTGERGRPRVSDDDLSDEGERTRDGEGSE